MSAQILLRADYYPLGIAALRDMEAWNGDSNELFRYQVYQLTCIKNYTDKLSIVNDKRAKQIKRGHKFYIASVIMILLSFIMFFCLKDSIIEFVKILHDFVCNLR